LIAREKDNGLFRCLVSNIVDNGLFIVEYASDTILFMENNLEVVKNMKLLLCAFEQLSGLKINFHKSEISTTVRLGKEFSQIFGCDKGTLPFRYLGIPMHHRNHRNSYWKLEEERFQNKLSVWNGNMLSVGGQLILVISILSNLPMFVFSFFRFLVASFKD
jgi:hypothetical protein